MDIKSKVEEGGKGYDFSRSLKSRRKFKFGARDSNAIAVDISLANLFQRLTVECSGVLGNPQWKHFRHMELVKNDQIRLSNGIWRSWHMQFQKGMKPKFCTFEINPKRDELSHQQPQAIVLEGKYWKRTDDAVAMEYRKWRLYSLQKLNWPNIRRLPNQPATLGMTSGSSVAMSKQQQSDPLPMQAESSDFKLNQIYQAIEDFPDSLFDIPMDEKGHMRSLVDSVDVVQQPYLGMLNPTVDEMMLEPMDVMFPSLGIGNRPPLSFAPPVTPSVNSPQQHPADQTEPGVREETQPYPTSMQYENQASPYINIPPRNYYPQGNIQGTMPYEMTPSSYLNMQVDPRLRPQGDVMDIGTPPIESLLKSGTSSSKGFNSGQATTAHLYHSQASHPSPYIPLESISNQQDKFNSLLTQIMNETSDIPGSTHQSQNPSAMAYQPSAQYGYANQHSSPNLLPEQSYTTPPPVRRHSSSLGSRKSSGGDLSEKTELEMQLIAEEMKQLEAEQLKHLQELEQQQHIASQQYLQLLQEYVDKSGSQPPSQQQQQVLMSVLSDPTSLSILKAIFKDGGPISGGEMPLVAAKSKQGPSFHRGDVKREPITPPTVQQGGVAQSYSTYPQPHNSSILSPSPVDNPPSVGTYPVGQGVLENEDEEVSEFQSRLIRAAAAQASFATADTSQHKFSPLQQRVPSTATCSSSTLPSLTSPQGGSSDLEMMPPSPALLKKYKNARNLTPEEKKVYQELRRQSHITAEQRRRGSIKNGFDHLQSLVINPAHFPSGKISKATILEKTIEYIQHQHHERENREKKIHQLKDEMKELNEAITLCQEKLPVTGAPVTRQRFEENRQYFKEYIRQRTHHNYKFWIYSIILQQLFSSYNSMVSTASTEELCQTVMTWFEQSCSLPALRPIVMSSLRELSMKTSILSDPSKVPEQLTDYAVTTTSSN